MWKGWGRSVLCVSAARVGYGAGFILMKNSGLSTMLTNSRALIMEGAPPRGAAKFSTVVGIANESDQVTKGHLVNALAVGGYEGRGTLR